MKLIVNGNDKMMKSKIIFKSGEGYPKPKSKLFYKVSA